MSPNKYYPFSLALGLGTASASILAWRCLRTLGSGQDAEAITNEFGRLQGQLSWCVPLVFILLLFLQVHAYLRRGASGWIFVVGWLYFVLFTAVDYVWLSDAVFRHTKETGTWRGGFNAMGLVGIFLALIGGLVSLVLLAIVRSRRRRHVPEEGSA